ncbi:MAG: tripartite tricarboxylate transporter TctB family protein [Pseudomonadota bacterium]
MAAGKARMRKAGGELVIPVVAVAFTLYYFSTIWNSPWTAQVGAFLVGGVLLFLCAIFAIKVALEFRRREATLDFSNLVNIEDVRTGRLGLIATTIAYCYFVEDFGFTLTTFVFLFASMAILNQGRKIPLALGLSAAMALGGWALFVWAFDTRFPRGWFEETMKGITG